MFYNSKIFGFAPIKFRYPLLLFFDKFLMLASEDDKDFTAHQNTVNQSNEQVEDFNDYDSLISKLEDLEKDMRQLEIDLIREN